MTCDGCAPDVQPRNDIVPGGSSGKHGLAYASFTYPRLEPLPTHVTARWTTTEGTSRCELPLGLMVENAPYLPFGPTASTKPFLLPLAPTATTLRFNLAKAEMNKGRLLDPNVRLGARVENTGSLPVQVDRAAFSLAIGTSTWKPVDNETSRPMKDWGSGMAFCLEGLSEESAFPDHAVLRPGERIEGFLCWTSDQAVRSQGGKTKLSVGYGEPKVFRAELEAR